MKRRVLGAVGIWLRYALPRWTVRIFLPWLDAARMRQRAERAEVQLAGCSVAALGDVNAATRGDWGWSASYEDVARVRRRLDALVRGLSPGDHARYLARLEREETLGLLREGPRKS